VWSRPLPAPRVDERGAAPTRLHQTGLRRPPHSQRSSYFRVPWRNNLKILQHVPGGRLRGARYMLPTFQTMKLAKGTLWNDNSRA
jgi:hypothetical protein